LSKDRYLERRGDTEEKLQAVKAKLAAHPKVARPDTDQLLAIADSLNGTPPDDEEWREIVVEMLERVVIGKKVEVHWKALWKPVISFPAAR
jgi:Holliday junction resolvase RusA-like endonuclease